MRFVFTSYAVSPSFYEPQAWLKRINAYSGIQEALSRRHEVISIEQINYEGQHFSGGVAYHFKRYSKIASRYIPFRQNLYIKNLRPDAVIVQSANFPLQVILLRMVLGPGVKIIIQNHAERPGLKIRKSFQRLADKCVDAYLFASYPMGIEWVAAGNISSASKIHEVMEVSSVFYPAEKALAMQKTGVQGNPVFLWVGRLDANKDPLTVVKAFLQFAQPEPDARLYMIYHTEELLPAITELLANSEHAQKITLIGKMPHDDLLYWYNSADFIISGSYYEGSGTSVCEAMSCGCVPIVTDILSFRMITNNGNCGLLYPPGDEQALFNALIATRRMDVWDKRKRSLTYYQSTLSFDAIAGRIAEVAQSL